LIETKKALKEIKEGEALEVITDHAPATYETIPAFCEKRLWIHSCRKGESISYKNSKGK
jgi:TusA-related sulfurtransferase